MEEPIGIRVRTEVSQEFLTVVALGCDTCHHGRMLLSDSLVGMAAVRCLGNRLPYKAGVQAGVVVNGMQSANPAKELTKVDSTTDPEAIRPCPPDTCNYNEKIEQGEKTVKQEWNAMGARNVRAMAEPRPWQSK